MGQMGQLVEQDADECSGIIRLCKENHLFGRWVTKAITVGEFFSNNIVYVSTIQRETSRELCPLQ